MIQEVQNPSLKGCHPEAPLQWNEGPLFEMEVPHPRGLPHLVPWADVSACTLQYLNAGSDVEEITKKKVNCTDFSL